MCVDTTTFSAQTDGNAFLQVKSYSLQITKVDERHMDPHIDTVSTVGIVV